MSRLKKIKNESRNIDLLLKNKKRKPVKLKGILKGVKITDKDIENAKKSLFKVKRI